MTRARAFRAAVLILALVVCCGVGLLLFAAARFRIPSADDAGRAKETRDLVAARFASRDLTIEWAPVGDHIELWVSGPGVRATCDELAAYVSALRRERSLPEVQLRFYDGAHGWVVTPD